jgi:hypothetical protein
MTFLNKKFFKSAVKRKEPEPESEPQSVILAPGSGGNLISAPRLHNTGSRVCRIGSVPYSMNKQCGGSNFSYPDPGILLNPKSDFFADYGSGPKSRFFKIYQK